MIVDTQLKWDNLCKDTVGYIAMKALLLGVCLALAACANLPNVNAEQEYTEAVRKLNLNPVYPPRQNLRVGDVFVEKNNGNGNDSVSYIGHLQAFEEFALDYDRSSFPLHLRRSTTDSAGKPLPFSDRASVMPIAFPSISVSAASAIGLGNSLPGSGGLLNFGRSRTVSIGFENTRQFGLQKGVLPPEQLYIENLRSMISQHPEVSCPLITDPMDPAQQEIIAKETPLLLIVTRVIMTNLVTFTSSSASAGRFSGMAQQPTATASQPTPQVALNISLPNNTSAQQVQEVMAAAAQNPGQNSYGIGGVITRGSIITYSKPIDGYVAVAYDAYSPFFCN